ncbi:MAG TPA: ABC transporter permease [Gemmatimonadaceae bacterium]|nr:ABC transporter permease [Gemmatimonadaceae bacterium]
MRGFVPMVGKELREIRRTWRLWVVPGMILFFAVTGPIMALLTPKLLASVASQQPGVVVRVPDPTALDAYAQFVKGLSQLVIIALIIGGAGSVSGERASGTAMLVLTKPVSRKAFVLAKLAADLALVLVATLVATAITLLVTRAVFPPLPARPLVTAVAIWLVHGALTTSAVTCFSAALRTRGAAAGAGLAFLMAQAIAGIWPAAERFTFVGLTGVMGGALRGAMPDAAWPVATGLAATLLFAVAAVTVFERQEI